MSLFFNTLSRFVIAILLRRKRLLISWLQWFMSPRKWNLILFSHFPHLVVMKLGPDAMIFIFECWVLSQLFHSSFTFIKRLFNSSLLSVIRVISSTYLRLLIFSLEILIPACASSSLAFHMMYSAYKLNKQGNNIQPWRTPFPIWNQSIVPCLVLLLLDMHTGFSGGR